MAPSVVGMLAPSITARQPFPMSACASDSSSSFWVAHGSAMSHGTSHTEPSVTTRARRPSEIDGQHYRFIDRDAFELLRERGFDICGFKASRRKQSSEMQPQA